MYGYSFSPTVMVGVKISPVRLRHYMRIYRLCVSSDESWLVASDNLCRLCVFKLSVEGKSTATQQLSHAVQLEYPVFAMQTVGHLLLCGDSHGRLLVFRWEDLTKKQDDQLVKPISTFHVFEGVRMPFTGPQEINALQLSPAGDRLLVAGAADNAIIEYDSERFEKPLRSYPGHSGYVTELAHPSADVFCSSSADGTVRVWDVRSSEAACTLNIKDEQRVIRSDFGDCVSTLSVDGDVMVCGGGVDLGIWHMRTRSLAQRLDLHADKHHLSSAIAGEQIVCGGGSRTLEQWNLASDKTNGVETHASAIFAILKTKNAWYSAGDSHLIDVFLNLGYVAYSLDAYPIVDAA